MRTGEEILFNRRGGISKNISFGENKWIKKIRK